MFELRVKKSDLNRITQRLEKIARELQNEKSPVLSYQVHLLDEYKNVVAAAMGSVKGSGGSVFLDFELGTARSWWAGLAPFTMAYKAYKNGTSTAALTIWEDTGETKQAVGRYGDFAGIDGSRNPEEYKRAINTEYGDTLGDLVGFGGGWPKRALFTIANKIFVDNKDEIVEEVRRRVNKTIENSGWGRY